MKDLLKSFLAFGLATTFEKLIAFALVPLYVNVFTVEEFGTFDLIQTTIGILAIFGLLQFESALQRYFYDYEGLNKRRFVSTIFISVIGFSLIIVLLVVITAPYISAMLFKTTNYTELIILSVFQIPLNNLIMLSLLILRYEKRNITFTILLLSKVILTLCLILLFVLYLESGIEGIFIARIIAGVISIGLIIFVLRNHFLNVFSIQIFKKVIKYSFPLFPAGIGSVLSANLNRFFISTFLTITAVGIYAFSLRIASVMQMIYVAFMMAWGPFLFSKLKEKNHKEYLSKILILIEIPIVVIIIGVCLFSNELIDVISPEDYTQSSKYVGGLTLYYSLFIFKEAIDIGPKATEKTKYISYNYFITLFFNFILLYFLIKSMDLAGVVIAMIVTNTILFVVSWFVSNKLYPISYSILTFIIIFIPAYIFTILLMFIDLSLIIRIFISLAIIGLYTYIFTKELYKHKRTL